MAFKTANNNADLPIVSLEQNAIVSESSLFEKVLMLSKTDKYNWNLIE